MLERLIPVGDNNAIGRWRDDLDGTDQIDWTGVESPRHPTSPMS